MTDFDENIDPRAELERLIVESTCEWCGEIGFRQRDDDNPPDKAYATIIKRAWLCRVDRKGGYISRHSRFWRVCDTCFFLAGSKRALGDFSKWIFPVIGTYTGRMMMQSIVEVQPMELPAPQVFYLDYLVTPKGVVKP